MNEFVLLQKSIYDYNYLRFLFVLILQKLLHFVNLRLTDKDFSEISVTSLSLPSYSYDAMLWGKNALSLR